MKRVIRPLVPPSNQDYPPQLLPLGTGSSWRDTSARMRGLGGTYAPGVSETPDIGTQFGDSSRAGMMQGDPPYPANMANSQELLRYAPPMPLPIPRQTLPGVNVGPVPQGPPSGYEPYTPCYDNMTADPSQYQPMQTPLSTQAIDPAEFPTPGAGRQGMPGPAPRLADLLMQALEPMRGR